MPDNTLEHNIVEIAIVIRSIIIVMHKNNDDNNRITGDHSLAWNDYDDRIKVMKRAGITEGVPSSFPNSSQHQISR